MALQNSWIYGGSSPLKWYESKRYQKYWSLAIWKWGIQIPVLHHDCSHLKWQFGRLSLHPNMACSQTGMSSPFQLFMAMSIWYIYFFFIFIYIYLQYIWRFPKIGYPQSPLIHFMFRFSIRTDPDFVTPRFPGGTQVVFPNGEVDPWHSLSVLVAGRCRFFCFGKLAKYGFWWGKNMGKWSLQWWKCWVLMGFNRETWVWIWFWSWPQWNSRGISFSDKP